RRPGDSIQFMLQHSVCTVGIDAKADGDFPICVAKDGTIIVALQWDYAAWTAGAAGFASNVQKLAAQAGKNKNALVALSGQVSSRLREELEKRGFMVRDRLVPGPLK
ncbi:MAG TPA: hypothetical protein VK639_20810, partial [Terriglobales bacterium]|nr:hypothetical protein [Terriglobales bacterium]